MTQQDHRQRRNPDARHSSRWSGSAGLIGLQILAFGLPLLTLPILSRGLGITGFGELMLAQSLALLVALFVDAGLNAESQRQVSSSEQPAEQCQYLWANLMVRSGLALLATLLLIVLNILFDWVNPVLLAASLLQVVGTLVFPQWWLIATGHGLMMGVSLVLGRLVSALAVWLWVSDPSDLWWASLALSSSSLLAGLLLWRQVWQPLWQYHHTYQIAQARRFFQRVRPMLFSAFFAQMSSNLPVVALGQWQTLRQVGLFSAAERLVRAAAHLSTYVEQIVLSRLAQPDLACIQQRFWQRRALWLLAVGLLIGGLLGQWLAMPVMGFLYGEAFTAAVPIFRVLLLWLMLLIFRRAWLMWTWVLDAQLHRIARLQWLETLLVSSAAVLGAIYYGGLGVAWLLCVSEVVLLCYICIVQYRPQKSLTKQPTPHQGTQKTQEPT